VSSAPLSPPTLTLSGVAVPTFLYGTAWKEDATEGLVTAALEAGFRGIDTANQRRHYHEAGVGQALAHAFESGTVSREDLFLQTKFTFPPGQDHRLPYDPDAPAAEKVRQSFASSLEHLGVETLDAYVLHGPLTRHGLTPEDWEAWGAMEELHREGRTRLLGASNMTASQLAELCENARVPPVMIQNRCFARLGWDAEVRRVCAEKDVVYQGFSLLTANRYELGLPPVQELAARHEATVPELVFAFARDLGMIRLTGTTKAEHMALDLGCDRIELSPEEIRTLEGIGIPR